MKSYFSLMSVDFFFHPFPSSKGIVQLGDAPLGSFIEKRDGSKDYTGRRGERETERES